MKRRAIVTLVCALLAVPGAAHAQLSGAQFRGLTEIAMSTSSDLTGISAADLTITKPDGGTVPASAIKGVTASGNQLVVDLTADPFARTTSAGTTIATKAFGSHPAYAAVPVARSGEPAANAHILGASRWTDLGWSTQYSDPATSFYWFQDLTPNRDDANAALPWNDGGVTKPAHRDLRILVLFVDFPDRTAAGAQAGWTTIEPYMDFLQPAVSYWNTTSYGQLHVQLISPQLDQNLPFIRMSKNSVDYPWGTSQTAMFAYAREAFQKLYDSNGVKPDDYDQVVMIPARGRTGLANGPTNINSSGSIAYVDHDGKNHYVSTVLTAGNDMFSWGYRWMLHEWGHSAGLPDLYMYSPTTVLGTNVNQFFWVGGWDIMGNIGGHATDYTAWDKYKFKWVRDDQVDVVSQPSVSTHSITPSETPGGTKMTVIRTGLTTAYVAEFRTKLGVDGLDNRAKYQGVLLYRIDTGQWQQFGTQPAMQIMSKQYYNDPAVGGSANKNGIWRPVSNSLAGLDTQAALWGPGDVFEDPATGVRIDFGNITGYTADDTASLTVTTTKSAQLDVPVSFSGAKLLSATSLHVDTSTELQRRAVSSDGTISTRQRSAVTANELVLTRGDGTVVPASAVTRVTVRPTGLDLTLAAGTFPTAASAKGLTVSMKPFYYFEAAAPAPAEIHLGDVGATVPATLSLTLGTAASFGAFAPGVEQDYTATMTANVISSAGDATLSVSDPGHLANGAFALAEPLQVAFSKSTWAAPVANDPVNIGFTQHIKATDPLRTGSYTRTLTFSLSTTTP